MHVDDSYEIAVRRLSRLGHARVDRAPPPSDRLRDLEELATLACDDNERLTRELDSAHATISRLQRLAATLQETIANAQSDEPFAAPKKRGGGVAFGLFAIAIVGVAVVALFMFRPWERPRAVSVAADVVTAPAIPPSAPVVAAAPPPSIPKVEPTIPKIAPTVPKIAPPTPKIKSQRPHGAKHQSAKSHRHAQDKRGRAARSNKAHVSETDDPLGGVSL